MLICFSAIAQQSYMANNKPASTFRDTTLSRTITAMNLTQTHLPIEKIYLQTDKPYYTSGDTLRFKCYLLNADYLTPSIRSGLAYIELDDVAGRMVKRIMAPVTSGIGWGDIILDKEDIPEGSYTLRAYTRWMLNFDEDYIFKKNFYVSSINNGSTLANAAFKLETGPDKDKVTAGLLFTTLSGDALRLRDIRLKVRSANKTLFRDKINTGIDGNFQFNFDLTDKTAIKTLSIQTQQTGKGADTTVLTIPVVLNRPENIDLQFMPEGGNLVAGIISRLGFKAIGENGKGTEVEGTIVNSRQQQVAVFQSAHNGMGSFELTPQAGETYTANIGTKKNYPLPIVNAAGIALKITPKGDDSLQLTIQGTDVQGSVYCLIGQSRGVVCFAAMVRFKDVPIKMAVAKNVFPTGIARFTILNSNNQAVNERIVYINKSDDLKVNITSDKPNYKLRDSIALHIQVNDKDGMPVQGIFSIAVTDNNQVKTDSLGNNIISNLLFTSDLKGTVEEPGWYFENNQPERANALDNLLLTQGWVGYDWKQVFNTAQQQPKYRAEKEFTIQGKLTNILNKPVKNTRLTLLQKKPLLLLDTLSDNEGNFTFKSKYFLPSDSTYYLIQTKNKNGNNRSFNIGIDVDEFVPPEFAPLKDRPQPWYVNSDTLLLKNAVTKLAQIRAEEGAVGGGHLLKEVVIKDKKIIPGSKNLNGPGGADITLDEKDMFKARNMTLYELLKQKYKDFHKIEHNGRSQYFWDYHGTPLIDIVIDSIRISDLHFSKDMFMDMLTASEIKGIEVMTTGQYALLYVKPPMPYKPGMVFLEITTYSGHGAFLTHTPGRYVYKAIPLSLPRQVYSPKYIDKYSGLALGTDLRSTVYWQPNVVTNAEGKATVSFFSADKPAGYTAIIEGTDLNGGLGYQRQEIKIVSKMPNR
jgi:hypothetical protein